MLAIRPALAADTVQIMAFIRELAVYEKLEDAVVATEADIAAALFGPSPRVFAAIAEWNGQAAGFALWYYSYSTFSGRHGIYLEDLFVRPAFRGKGMGKALIADLAQRCVDERLPRLEWSVLDWNAPAIAFYRAIGAGPMDEWTVQRLTGAALGALAGTAPRSQQAADPFEGDLRGK